MVDSIQRLSYSLPARIMLVALEKGQLSLGLSNTLDVFLAMAPYFELERLEQSGYE